MLDWKILAAGLVALIFVASLLLGGLGFGDFFSDIISKIGEWLQNSPFGGFSVPGSAGDKSIEVFLYPSNLKLMPDNYVNISSPLISLENFRGEIDADFNGGYINLTESNSRLRLNFSILDARISGLRLRNFKMENLVFNIPPDLAIDNGTIEFQDFSGTGTISSTSFLLNGTAKKIRLTVAEKTWELS